MSSHNTKAAFAFHKTPVVTDTDKEEAEVISTSLIIDSELTIADEHDTGCDPYNSTGQHLVIRPKKPLDR